MFLNLNLTQYYLLGKLFLTELVQGEELASQHNVVNETNRGEFYTNDDLTIRHHHSNCTEVDLQILWQLLATSIARVLEEWKQHATFTYRSMGDSNEILDK